MTFKQETDSSLLPCVKVWPPPPPGLCDINVTWFAPLLLLLLPLEEALPVTDWWCCSSLEEPLFNQINHSSCSCLFFCFSLAGEGKDTEMTADLWYNLCAAKPFLLRNPLWPVVLIDHQPCGERINSALHTRVTWQAANLCQSPQGHVSWLVWQPLLFNPSTFRISVNVAWRLRD